MHFTINKKKIVVVVLYMYNSLHWVCFFLFFLSKSVINATKIYSFKAGFATEVDAVQQLHALQKKYNKFHLSGCFVSYVIYLYYKKKPFLNKRLNLAVKLPVFGPT